MTATTLVALLQATGAAAQSGDAESARCADPQGHCARLVAPACLEAFGAGSIAVGDAPAPNCEAQLTSYRDCLSEVVSLCGAARPTPQQGAEAGAPVSARVLEALSALGGLIADPRTEIEFYNNALVYERRGDALSARRMYERAIALGLAFVDVHARYVALLKAQEGLLGAREVYADLVRRAPENGGARLAQATLAPAPQREAALRALVVGADPLAPAQYELSRLFSADRLGAQSREDRLNEKAALEAFAAADERGAIARWFLDKSALERWRADADRRLAAYRSVSFDAPPVSFTATPSNDGWIVNFAFAEAVRAVRYRVDNGEIVEMGDNTFIDPRTGAPMPRTFFTLPLGVEAATIEVWYDDIRSSQQGPFPIAFNAAQAFTDQAKNVLGALTQKWIEGRDFDGRFLIYFSHLLSYRCGLSEIAYGVDRDTPNETWPFSPCDPRNPYAVGADDEIYRVFDQRPGKIVVQLTYADGETSELRAFTY